MTIFNFNFGHYCYVAFLKRIQNFLTLKNKFKIHCIKFAKWNLFFHSKMRLLLSQLHFSFVFYMSSLLLLLLFCFFSFTLLFVLLFLVCRHHPCHRHPCCAVVVSVVSVIFVIVNLFLFDSFVNFMIWQYFISFFISILFKHEKTIKKS